MRDEISKWAGVANSYKDFPLSALRQMQSILDWEIEQRLLSFGEVKVDKVVGSVGDVESENVADKVGNNVVIGNFRGNK